MSQHSCRMTTNNINLTPIQQHRPHLRPIKPASTNNTIDTGISQRQSPETSTIPPVSPSPRPSTPETCTSKRHQQQCRAKGCDAGVRAHNARGKPHCYIPDTKFGEGRKGRCADAVPRESVLSTSGRGKIAGPFCRKVHTAWYCWWFVGRALTAVESEGEAGGRGLPALRTTGSRHWTTGRGITTGGASLFGQSLQAGRRRGMCCERGWWLSFLNPCCRMRCSCGHGEGERAGRYQRSRARYCAANRA